MFCGRTDAKAETPILWPPHVKSWLIGKDWCWEGLEAGGEGDNRGWDGWMASLTRWMWVWVNSGSWWWTGRPGVLPFMGSQRVNKTEQLNWNITTVDFSILLSPSLHEMFPWYLCFLEEISSLSIKDINGMHLTKAKILRRGGKNTQKNYIKKIFVTQITRMVWSFT